MSCTPGSREPPRITLLRDERYSVLFPFSKAADPTGVGKIANPLPSLVIEYVAPATVCVNGLPLEALTEWPKTLTSEKPPCALD